MSATFDEVQFPNKIDYGFEGGPRYSTTVIEMDNGREQRKQHWPNGRHEWTTSSGIKNGDDRDEIIAFFHARRGRARGFRWKDWNDYRVLSKLQTVQLTTTTFQLVKRYVSGDQTVVRTIRKPVAGSVTLFKSDNTPITSGWTIDATTGIITFSSAPGFNIYAIFQFDVPVRFDIDFLPFNRGGFAINTVTSIKVIEIKDYDL